MCIGAQSIGLNKCFLNFFLYCISPFFGVALFEKLLKSLPILGGKQCGFHKLHFFRIVAHCGMYKAHRTKVEHFFACLVGKSSIIAKGSGLSLFFFVIVCGKKCATKNVSQKICVKRDSIGLLFTFQETNIITYFQRFEVKLYKMHTL